MQLHIRCKWLFCTVVSCDNLVSLVHTLVNFPAISCAHVQVSCNFSWEVSSVQSVKQWQQFQIVSTLRLKLKASVDFFAVLKHLDSTLSQLILLFWRVKTSMGPHVGNVFSDSIVFGFFSSLLLNLLINSYDIGSFSRVLSMIYYPLCFLGSFFRFTEEGVNNSMGMNRHDRVSNNNSLLLPTRKIAPKFKTTFDCFFFKPSNVSLFTHYCLNRKLQLF